MGKRIIPQRRGRGTPKYRAPSHRYKCSVKYPPIHLYPEGIGGQIIELFHDPGHTAPIAKVLLEDYTTLNMIAPEGIAVNDWVGIGKAIGDGGEITPGTVLTLDKIPDGTQVFNIETQPGDGGKLVRAGGGAATVIGHEEALTYVRLPSKKVIVLNSKCRATVGKVAGGGRKDKPFIRAGQRFYASRAKGKLYPKVRGVAMNAVDHPHGGGRNPHSGGGRTCVKRNAPPGRKVGFFGARRTGRRKRS